MAAGPHKIFPAATCLLVRNGKTFLLRRANTGWSDGLFNPPAGHVEPWENPSAAAIREAFEEAGVEIELENLKAIGCMYRRSDREYVDFIFIAEKWQGEPKNNEPDMCDQVGWFDLDNLPENTVPFMKKNFENYKNGVFYSEFLG